MNHRVLLAAALTLLTGCPTNTIETDAAVSSDAVSNDAAVSPDAPAERRDREDPFEIRVRQLGASAGPYQHMLTPLFNENPCNQEFIGPCVLYTCPTPPNDGGLPPNTHVGTITLSGGQLAAPALFVPDETTGR